MPPVIRIVEGDLLGICSEHIDYTPIAFETVRDIVKERLRRYNEMKTGTIKVNNMSDRPWIRTFIAIPFGSLLIAICLWIFILSFELFLELFLDPLPTPHGFVALPVAVASICFAAYLYRSLFCSTSVSKNNLRNGIIGIVLMLIIVTPGIACLVWLIPPSKGEYAQYDDLPLSQVPVFRSFPKAGSDFKFQRAHRNRLWCDFSITEKEFHEWISSQEYWNGYKDVRDFNLPGQNRTIDGVIALPEMNPGANVAYDQNTNRAYYWKY